MQTRSFAVPDFPVSVPVAMFFGGLMTGVLLLIMQDLIRVTDPVPDKAEPMPITQFVRLLEDLPTPEPEPIKPPPAVKPPPETSLVVTGSDAVGSEVIDFPAPLVGVVGPLQVGVPDGDALPIVKVAPVYPRSAQSRGIEGYVVVRFDIDKRGRVVDAEVVEADPAGIFDRSALTAIARFRYKPRVFNGEPVRVADVYHRLTYEMAR